MEPEPEPAAASCDVAREAFLTGSDEEIEAALEALVADRSVDATAREAAQSYLEEDDSTPLSSRANTSSSYTVWGSRNSAGTLRVFTVAGMCTS